MSFVLFQGSADSNYSQPSSDLSLDEERDALRRETERQALQQLEKVRTTAPSTACHSILRVGSHWVRERERDVNNMSRWDLGALWQGDDVNQKRKCFWIRRQCERTIESLVHPEIKWERKLEPLFSWTFSPKILGTGKQGFRLRICRSVWTNPWLSGGWLLFRLRSLNHITWCHGYWVSQLRHS